MSNFCKVSIVFFQHLILCLVFYSSITLSAKQWHMVKHYLVSVKEKPWMQHNTNKQHWMIGTKLIPLKGGQVVIGRDSFWKNHYWHCVSDALEPVPS